MLKSKKGFSLLEVIIVVAMVVVFAAWFLVSSKPAKRIGEAADVQRQCDIKSIEKSIKLVATDFGSLSSDLTSLSNNIPYMIVKAGGSTVGTCACAATGTDIDRVDISPAIEAIMPNLPVDPDLAEDSNDTGYYLVKNGNNFRVLTCNSYALAQAGGVGGGTPAPSCGDASCNGTETCSDCEVDCGACPLQDYQVTLYPTAASGEGIGAIWTSPENVFTDDTNYVSWAFPPSGPPSDGAVYLIKADHSYSSESKAYIMESWPDVWTVYNYGNATALWGEAWTAADINDADFGLAFAACEGTGLCTQNLAATNFGFEIPPTAVIKGIKAEVDKIGYTTAKPMSGWAKLDFIRLTVYYQN